MTDVLFRFDVDAAPEVVLEAVKTTEGIKGFWTSRAEVPGDVGGKLKLEFAFEDADQYRRAFTHPFLSEPLRQPRRVWRAGQRQPHPRPPAPLRPLEGNDAIVAGRNQRKPDRSESNSRNHEQRQRYKKHHSR